MKNAADERTSVERFLESARAAALEEKRLERRMQALAAQRDALGERRSAAARKLQQLIEEERRREFRVVSGELSCYRSVEAFIARVPGRTNRMILRHRYLEPGQSWREIGKLMEKDGVAYSQRHLIRMHAQALEEARKLWESEGEEGTVRKRR